MHILIAPDSFKENLTAYQVCNSIEKGINKVFPKANIEKIPMSDGGEGAIRLFEINKLGKIIHCPSLDPILRPIDSSYMIFNDNLTAWIELSKASGLDLLQNSEKNPLITSTYGTGLLIKDAINRGCNKIILGIGGSATNDGGSGILSALGFKLKNKNNVILPHGGGGLKALNKIEIPKKNNYKNISFKIACDVNNVLLGTNGATAIFSEQKGASEKDKILLEKNMETYASVIEKTFSKNIKKIIGGGAAGGTAAGMVGALNAKITNGFSIISEIINLEKKIKKTDLIITGEGKLDFQSLEGKVPLGIAQFGKKYNIPVICIAGSIESPLKNFYKLGFYGIFSIQDKPMSVSNSFKKSKYLIENCVIRILSFYKKILKI
mgnify:CR=1 FL=1